MRRAREERLQRRLLLQLRLRGRAGEHPQQLHGPRAGPFRAAPDGQDTHVAAAAALQGRGDAVAEREDAVAEQRKGEWTMGRIWMGGLDGSGAEARADVDASRTDALAST